MERPLFLPGVSYGIALDRLFTAKEVDDFIALYQDINTTELQIHKFFSANPKFLYLLGTYNKVLSEVSFFGTAESPEAARKCFRLDFLLQHYRNVWDVVEIKKATLASGSLVVGSDVRPRFAFELQDAISQVRVYLDQLAQAEVQRELEGKGILVRKPKAWIIAGRNDDVPVSEQRFLMQGVPQPIECLTYDDLAELAKQRTLIQIKSIQFPLLSRLQEDVFDVPAMPELAADVDGHEKLNRALESLSRPDLLRLRQYAKWRLLSLQERGRTHGRDADDLLQEALFRTFSGRYRWREGTTLGAHLTRVMRNISSDWQRSPILESLAEDSVLDKFAGSESVGNLKETLLDLERLFEKESRESRFLNLLSRGHSRTEIQSELAMSEQTTASILKRIRRRIRRQMERG